MLHHNYYFHSVSDLIFVRICDLVPVYHNYPLAPLLELAAGATESQGLQVIGFYFANETLIDDNVPASIKSIEDGIISRTGSCALVKINNVLLGDSISNCLQVDSFPMQ